MNRLNLDFSLNSSEERSRFLESYLAQIDFSPTPTEMAKMADYVLWGDKPTNASSLGLETAWSNQTEIESLEGLKENPAFCETNLYALGDAPRTKTPRQKFSREEARANLEPSLLPALESLWHEIDALDFEISAYEVSQGKKEKIRSELRERLLPQEQLVLEARAQELSQYLYLKKRRLLVEKRREQFTFRDVYRSKILRHSSLEAPTPFSPPVFDADISVRPAGLPYATGFARKIFGQLTPDNFSEEELRDLTHLLWRDSTPNTFDFADENCVFHLLEFWEDLEDATLAQKFGSTLGLLMRALAFYRERANLSPVYDAILSLKIARTPNAKIRTQVNSQFGKTYSENYISTIYRQKIIPALADSARRHREELENLFFPENWKKCNKCGRTLLRSTDYFMRKAQSQDGFSPSCKRCDKAKRDAAKEKK